MFRFFTRKKERGGGLYWRSRKEEIFRSRGRASQESRGNRGLIYRGVALDKFISISMENTLDTHNAAKPRARTSAAINNATWCRMSRMRGGLEGRERSFAEIIYKYKCENGRI